MKLHKIIFVTCILMLIVLFINGIYALSDFNKRPKSGSNNHDIAKEQENIYIGSVHDESSIEAERPVNLLILGLDKEETRADVIALLNYGPEQGKINILSIARDTRVYVRGKATKINALIAIGGEKLVAKAVEKLTGLSVDYYLVLNFEGFRKVIDTLGGVEIYVPINMDYDDPDQDLHIHLRKGLQLLDGKKAEQFVRYRKGNRRGQGYTDGDIGRIKAQQEFMKALIDQKVKLRYLSKADDIYFILKKYMRTNIEIGDVRHYLKYLKNIKYQDVASYTIPGDSIYTNRTWYFICDRKRTRELINNDFFK